MPIDDTALVLIDVQGKLAEIMYESETLFRNLVRLTAGARKLGLPVLWLEQIPEKMGPTIQPLRDLLTGETPIAKKAFSCCGEPAFMTKVAGLGRKRLLLAGIETHVCVYQTAIDIARAGYRPEIVVDCVSSRTRTDRDVALDRLRSSGIPACTAEMVLFELLETAGHPLFKDILRIVK